MNSRLFNIYILITASLEVILANKFNKISIKCAQLCRIAKYLIFAELSNSFATSFSYLSNGTKLFTFDQTSKLSCLEGLKTLTVMWIVMGHTYAFQVNAPIFYFGQLVEVKTLVTYFFGLC